MNAAVQTAHDAYRNAAELTPARTAARVQVEFAQRRPAVEQPTWQDAVRWLDTPMDVRTDHLVAVGGAVFFLIAGLACGAWLQIT